MFLDPFVKPQLIHVLHRELRSLLLVVLNLLQHSINQKRLLF
jgi:hypothetical protein